MKNLIFAAAILMVAVANAVSGQVKSVAAASKPTPTSTVPVESKRLASRARVLGNETTALNDAKSEAGASQTPSQLELKNHPESGRVRRTADPVPAEGIDVRSNPTSKAPLQSPPPSNLFPSVTALTMAATQLYRIGANDVLDIQIAGNQQRESTLYTIGEQGLLEYPLAGEPVSVVGLTTAEIATRLRQRIKILDNPVINVAVRDYASHAVTVTGFVAAPGRKILRREAVPLYAMLAEALVLPEAGRATISRQGRAPMELDLNDAIHSATLVIAGDVIRVAGAAPRPSEFFFIGGAIGSPGQKSFHSGLTLTQALLASGGVTAKGEVRIRISRLGPNSRLVNADHHLKKIQSGKVADPVLEKGDRIEVIPGK